MSVRGRLGIAVVIVALTAPLTVAAAQPASPPPIQEPADAMVIQVVPLTYARAGELAYTLSLVAPAPVRVVPYYPTNSLIIAGPWRSVEQLIDIVKPPTSLERSCP